MKFLIAYNNGKTDNANTHFAFCGEEMQLEMETRGHEYVVLTPPLLTNLNLLQHLSACQVCFIANHGDTRSIAGDKGDIVSTTTNNSPFAGKLLYAVSCSCGKNLKDCLVEEGLLSFWGYNKDFKVFIGYPQYAKSCMAGIKSLMDGKTVREAKEDMIQQFNNDIAELESRYPDKPMLAAVLLDNREALVVYGEDNLSLKDLR